MDHLKRSEGGRRLTEQSVFKFFFESWLFFGQDFWITMDKKMSRDVLRILWCILQGVPTGFGRLNWAEQP